MREEEQASTEMTALSVDTGANNGDEYTMSRQPFGNPGNRRSRAQIRQSTTDNDGNIWETAKMLSGKEIQVRGSSIARLCSRLDKFFFYGMPADMPLHQKIALCKDKSTAGAIWDIFQIMLSVGACMMYVSSTYHFGYESVQRAYLFETFAISCFIADFGLMAYINMSSPQAHFTNFFTIIDFLTIVPYFLESASSASLMVFRVLKILRLLRIIKTSRVLHGVKGVGREILQLVIIIVSVVFLSSGMVHMVENYIKQANYDCKYLYVNPVTDVTTPSCESNAYTFDDADCDCQANACRTQYTHSDEGNPMLNPDPNPNPSPDLSTLTLP